MEIERSGKLLDLAIFASGRFLEEARAACETLGKIFGEAAEEGEKSAYFI